MRNTLTLLLLLIVGGSTFAQVKGTVQYTSTRKLEINIEGDMPPPPGLPDKIENKTVLYFTEKASLYKNAEQAEDAMNVDQEADGGQMVVMRMAPPENIVYCDLENKTVTQQRDFMQRKFLIEAPMNADGWKLTGKQKLILNYPCQEAMRADSTDTVSVWFTAVFPVSTGPMEYIGLPGLVLEVNVQNGLEIITATSVTKEADEKQIEKPKDGKKVTQEEYDVIVAEKLKEMGIEPGGPGGKVVIHIEND